MSANGPGTREVAWRVFAAEYDDASFSYSESDEERAPNYVVTPTGARVNRLFVVGVLTETEEVSDGVLRARVVDPTGAFVVYAGQYQPDALAFLERATPPAFVAVTGKARTFQPDDADVVYTSIRPESISEVDADTRDRWVVRTAEHTLDRVGTFAHALDLPERGDRLADVLVDAGVDDDFAAGIAAAIDEYGTTGAYLAAVRDLALDAARVVTGDREEVERLSLAPDEGDDSPAGLDLPPAGVDVETAEAGDATAGAAGTPAEERSTASQQSASEPEPEPTPSDGTGSEPGPARTVEAEQSEGDAGPAETASEPGDVETDAGGEETEPTATDSVAEAVDADPETVEEPVTDELYEFDEEERREIEENYDMEFSSGSDIPDQGEANIETPAPAEDTDETAPSGDIDESTVETEPEPDLEPESEPASEPESESASEPEPESASTTEFESQVESEPESGVGEDAETDRVDDGDATADVDPEDAVMEVMTDLDDGDGAAREDVVAAAADRFGLAADDVEDGIQSALMSGRCYEPSDDVFVPI